jgi:N-acetylglucosaminyl-diphospho-decaprenol L-rhamnosyltransferase
MLGAVSPDPVSPVSDIGVIVVAFGSDAVLPAFLSSVDEGARVRPRVIVADNQPSVGGAAAMAAQAGAMYLALDNRGYGAAINAAERELPADVSWLFVSNPDVVIGPGALDVLRARGETDPAVGAVGPRILNADGSVYPSARSVPSLRTGIGHALFGWAWKGNPWTRAYRRDDDTSAPSLRDAGWLSGACLLIRRSTFRELGGFDEQYFMYFEDVDFGFRSGRAGYRNVYEPAASATHTGAHSTSADSAAMVRVHHGSAARFLDRKYRGPVLWPLRKALRLGLGVRAALLTRAAERSQPSKPAR